MINKRKNRTQDLEALARFLDSRFQGPFGIRIGWDALLGLIPGIGGLITTALSFYIVVRAAHAGCSLPVLMRMGGNVLIDTALEAVPVLGNVADVFWRANNRNLEILHRHRADAVATKRESLLLISGLLFSLFLLLFASVWLAFLAARYLWHLFL